ncbi:hypothetical protein Tph_c07590 [Thermacetogenium phaeum DSM 12270]|uniref:Uncharacterized protein n=1 Tax=Thermacetogenium phaeum (strain ATCC BAA-254 / DSM 26808 / PB) TaxID=1089553 RepID=K4LDC7_THEPS|nr:hypothetical protein Tph_c07590 [Thermacetogenium phaeum DSM 12270]
MKKNYLKKKEKPPVSYIFSRLKPPVKRVAYFRRSGKRKR